MPLHQITDSQLRDNIRRYKEAGNETGGHYSLAQLLVEEKRRKPSPFPVVAMARKIIELSQASEDGQTTYLELWRAFRPGVEWQGHGSQAAMGNALAQVVAYCVRHSLPIITVLVVQTSSRKLDRKAVENIYEECRTLGLDAGSDPCVFIQKQKEASLQLILDQLPEEPST